MKAGEMASCNMCRNGLTALGRRCPNECRADSAADILQRLENAYAGSGDLDVCRDAIGEIVRLRDALKLHGER